MRRDSRAPLVPKEILLPVCQRLGFVLFVMGATAFSIRLWKQRGLGQWSANSRLRVNGTHTFLDIGSGNHGLQGSSPTRKLEENGWRGICADPFPENGRSCTALSMPVTAATGDLLHLSDCTKQNVSTSMVMMSTVAANCPTVDMTGVGIVDALKVTKAPRVIDYINLDTQGLELDILKRFPFQQHCARSWTVTYGEQKHVAAGIQQLLESQGCRVRDAGTSYWARCTCSHHSGSLLSTRATQHTAATPTALMRKNRPKKKSGQAREVLSMDSTATMHAK